MAALLARLTLLRLMSQRGLGPSLTRTFLAIVIVITPPLLDITRAAGSREGAVDALVVIGGGWLLARSSAWGWVRQFLGAYFTFDALLAVVGLLVAGWLVALANLAPYAYALLVAALGIGRLLLWQRLGLGWVATSVVINGVRKSSMSRDTAPRSIDASTRSRPSKPGASEPMTGEYLPPR